MQEKRLPVSASHVAQGWSACPQQANVWFLEQEPSPQPLRQVLLRQSRRSLPLAAPRIARNASTGVVPRISNVLLAPPEAVYIGSPLERSKDRVVHVGARAVPLIHAVLDSSASFAPSGTVSVSPTRAIDTPSTMEKVIAMALLLYFILERLVNMDDFSFSIHGNYHSSPRIPNLTTLEREFRGTTVLLAVTVTQR